VEFAVEFADAEIGGDRHGYAWKLAVQSTCWLLGQNVGWVLIGGIISPFSREAKKVIFSRGVLLDA